MIHDALQQKSASVPEADPPSEALAALERRHAFLTQGIYLTTAAGLGAITGLVACTADCTGSAWWNPVAAWSALKGASSNPILSLVAPEASQHAQIAGGGSSPQLRSLPAGTV